MLLLWGSQQVHTRSCIVSISTQIFAWYGNTLALLQAPLAGRDFSHLSFCCALRRCLKLYDSSALLLFLVCLLLKTTCCSWAAMCHHFLWSALSAYGLVALNLLPWAACCKSWSAKTSQKPCLLCKEGLQMKDYSCREGKKHSGTKCRCDWRMLLQKWTLYLGKPWSCLLCKYKAVNWIETSPEKQERKNRLSGGNSPFSKHRELLLDMPKLPSLTFSSLASGLEACLETRQEGGQSVNGLRERRWGN